MGWTSGELQVWALIVVVTVALNAIPAFMPPTWTVLAYFHLQHGLGVVPLALVGAAGATGGRALLALASRAVGPRIVPAQWRTNIEALADMLPQRRSLGFAALALFALGPVPSNHLFIAAGLARAPLGPIVAVFGAARCVSYLVWVSATATVASSLRDVIAPRFGSGAAVAAQIVGFALLIVLMQIDWRKRLQRWFRD
ncbi:MAG TPA: hypothetical protein VFU81_01660 [Thermomicrobiales bacterium]|nr:hypothetical protein [Thermomicrobiales bacterium]